MNNLKQIKKDTKKKAKDITKDWMPDFSNLKQEKFFLEKSASDTLVPNSTMVHKKLPKWLYFKSLQDTIKFKLIAEDELKILMYEKAV